ncbi:MAG: iron ABC transporter permease [Synergistetes bacterium]|nr:iron ABC transporter permease [Synergistota bacterium]
MRGVEEKYRVYLKHKLAFGLLLLFFLAFASSWALCTGDIHLSVAQVLKALFGRGDPRSDLVIWNIRLPRVIASLLVGTALSVSGCVMQCILRNPLASPFTMGVSHGAMFGAALAIITLDVGGAESSGRIFINNPYIVSVSAFLGALMGVFVVLILAKLRGLTPEAMILAGVAIGSLFTAGTMLIQYFADELQLAAMVYWTFGDLSRPVWKEIAIMTFLILPSLSLFIRRCWDYNALESGEEAAKSLGVNTQRVRLMGMIISSLITSTCVAFVGIIGFIGLITPHICRLTIGGDYRFLIPISAILGSLILLISDTLARTLLSPIVLPVGVITSFMGAPTFLYLLVKLQRR